MLLTEIYIYPQRTELWHVSMSNPPDRGRRRIFPPSTRGLARATPSQCVDDARSRRLEVCRASATTARKSAAQTASGSSAAVDGPGQHPHRSQYATGRSPGRQISRSRQVGRTVLAKHMLESRPPRRRRSSSRSQALAAAVCPKTRVTIKAHSSSSSRFAQSVCANKPESTSNRECYAKIA